MWKVLLAVFLVVVLLILYSNDKGAQKSIDSLKAPVVAPAVAPTAPVVAPVDPVVVPVEPKKEGFCPKLMQKYGFCDAGESMNNPARGSVWDRRLTSGASAVGSIGRERLAGGNIAKNTVWSGYMKSAVLPY